MWFAALVTLILSGCSADAPLDTLDPKGPAAQSIDELWDVVFAIAVVVFVLVQAGIIFLMVKFRDRDGDPDDLPEQVHGNFALEIGWTILPAIVLAVVAVLSVGTLFDLEKRDENALPVRVIGQQWWWEYQYDVNGDGEYTVDDPASGDFRTSGEMVIPAGRQMDLQIESYDVIHSFWIPPLNGKRDAVPGRVHTLSLEADEPGEYYGSCTEFCGLSHSRMRMRVRAVTDSEFDTWMANQSAGADMPEGVEAYTEMQDELVELQSAETPDADAITALETELVDTGLGDAVAGRDLFVANCSSCHEVRGDWGNGDAYGGFAAQVSGNAPDLTHLMSRSTFAGSLYDLYLREDDVLDAPYVGLSPETATLNEIQLERWIANAPGEKAMAPVAITAEDSRTGEAIPGRGMPSFESLTRTQIDQLVAYLATLD